jgi:hypothetical protein
MSRTYKDKTGIIFHYNSDLSGGVEIVVPPNNPHGDGTSISIEADVLSRFITHTMFDAEETLAWIDKMRDWINRHTFAGANYREEHSLGPIIPCADGYKFKPGERVFLTFSEANGETGIVTDVGRWPSGNSSYEYADVKLDKDGTQTGPLPVTCVRLRRPEDQ